MNREMCHMTWLCAPTNSTHPDPLRQHHSDWWGRIICISLALKPKLKLWRSLDQATAKRSILKFGCNQPLGWRLQILLAHNLHTGLRINVQQNVLLITLRALVRPFTSNTTLIASYLVDSCDDTVGEGIEVSEDVEDAAPARWIGLGRLLAGAPHGPLAKSWSHRAAMGWAGAAATTPPGVQCVPAKDVVHHQWMRSDPESRALHWPTQIHPKAEGEWGRLWTISLIMKVASCVGLYLVVSSVQCPCDPRILH